MRRLAAVALVVVVATAIGCSDGAEGLIGSIPPTQATSQAKPPTPAVTDLATEPPPPATASAEASRAAEPSPSPKKATYYQPPGWDGYSDVNCKDFSTHTRAQSFFKGTGGTKSNDPYGLDNDGDGIACESLP